MKVAEQLETVQPSIMFLADKHGARPDSFLSLNSRDFA
jgi:hypothetical protein